MITQLNGVERGCEELIKLLRDILEEFSFVEKKLPNARKPCADTRMQIPADKRR